MYLQFTFQEGLLSFWCPLISHGVKAFKLCNVFPDLVTDPGHGPSNIKIGINELYLDFNFQEGLSGVNLHKKEWQITRVKITLIVFLPLLRNVFPDLVTDPGHGPSNIKDVESEKNCQITREIGWGPQGGPYLHLLQIFHMSCRGRTLTRCT